MNNEVDKRLIFNYLVIAKNGIIYYTSAFTRDEAKRYIAREHNYTISSLKCIKRSGSKGVPVKGLFND